MSNLLYDALMLGRNKKVENEEFQVATGRKEAASFRVTEESVNISNVITDGEFSVHLIQDSPGYLEIEVLCSDSFILFDKKVVTTEEFTEGRMELTFTVFSDRLHNGRNFTSIFLRSSRQSFEVPVVVDNKIRIQAAQENPRERIYRLERAFLDLHMEKLEAWNFEQESLDLLNEIPGGDENSLFLMLYKAQIYLTRGDAVHARNYIEYVGTQIPKLEKKSYDLYCYFIYLASLYEEIDSTINAAVAYNEQEDARKIPEKVEPERIPSGMNIMDMSALQKVHWVYRHFSSWKILWILFYMDPVYQADRVRRLDEMQEMYYQGGFTSPIMYFEALKVLRNSPHAMIEAGPFELQVLNFAVKNRYLTPQIADRLAELILSDEDKGYSDAEKRLALKILKFAYERFSGIKILTALCRILASFGKKDPKDHIWFEKALSAGNDQEWILDNYIYTLDETVTDPLPENILRHFLSHMEQLHEYREYMFASIITHKYSAPWCYQESLHAILRFAEFKINQGLSSTLLAVIYKEILENDLLTPAMRTNLFDVICTREVFCENDRMVSVLVFHRELQIYQESFLKDGRGLIRMYSSDALVLFKDATGNLYHNIAYRLNTLIETREYIDVCIKDAQINKYMLMGDTLPILRAYRPAIEILQYFTSHRLHGEFRHEYERELLNGTVSYYAKNSRDEKVYDELLKFRELDLPVETRRLLIGIMLRRGLVNEAYEEVSEYGTMGMSDREMADLAHACIQLKGTAPDPMVTLLCESGFRADGFDEYIFDYLFKNYNGKLDLLIDLYRSSNAYGRESTVLEERILRKSMETGEHPDIVSLIFSRYHEEGPDKELIRAYIEFRSSLYLYDMMTGSLNQGGTSDLSFFSFMEQDMLLNRPFGDDSVIAFLLYRINADISDEKRIRNIEQHLKDLVRRGKMLEEFKYYKRYFPLPATLANNIIISAFSEDTESKPQISYEITGSGNVVTGCEEMEEIFRFCYVKYFTLFFGEKVIFSMDGKESTEVAYKDLEIIHDGSRYAALDDLIRYHLENDRDAFLRSARDFYVKQRMTEFLF